MPRDNQSESAITKLLSLLRAIHIHPLYLLIPIGFSLASALLEGASLGMLIPILNGFLQKSFTFVNDIPVLGKLISYLPETIRENDRLLFGAILGGFLMIYSAKNILRYGAVVSMAYFGERSLHHLRKILFSRYVSFGKLYFDTTNIGHHATLLTEFSRQAISPLLLIDKFINALFSLTVYLIVLMMISWKLTVIALPLFAILHFAIKFMVVHIKGLSRQIATRGSELGKKSIEILSTIPLVKAYNMERAEQDNYASISNEKAKLDFRVKVLQNLILPLQEIITIFVATAVFMSSLFFFGRDQI
ncbi:MAG: hypothetical protein KC680_04670, partial [Candidatus Peregrinibacteria bacterium]|nr:hypothetical protein [Candidatus Peregrinibacteria bacterium]